VQRNPFTLEGNWYKGNLHTHSTNSDGLYTPLQVINWYWERGYDFLSLTDHRVLTIVEDLPKRSPLLIPGMELNGQDESTGGDYHIVGLGLRSMLKQPESLSAQEAIDAIVGDGGLAVLAHPYWLGQIPTDLLHLERAIGLEVFNTSVPVTIAKGFSACIWDALLDRKCNLFGLAVDDTHWRYYDGGQGWVMVKAAACTPEAILSALAQGAFYASQGPVIYDFRVEDGIATARTSPVKSIAFMAERSHGRMFTAANGGLLTEARYVLRNERTYVRLECVDAEGRTAWSNPIWLT